MYWLCHCPQQPVQEGASIPNMVGFYAPHQKNTHRGTGSLPTGGGERVPHTGQVDSSVGKDDLSSSREESESQDDAHRTERVECVRDEPKRSEACGELVCGEVEKQEEEEEEEEEEEGSDSDGEGWITPENFQQVCEEMGGVSEERPRSLAVGCMTTDFAMQVIHTSCPSPIRSMWCPPPSCAECVTADGPQPHLS